MLSSNREEETIRRSYFEQALVGWRRSVAKEFLAADAKVPFDQISLSNVVPILFASEVVSTVEARELGSRECHVSGHKRAGRAPQQTWQPGRPKKAATEEQKANHHKK